MGMGRMYYIKIATSLQQIRLKQNISTFLYTLALSNNTKKPLEVHTSYFIQCFTITKRHAMHQPKQQTNRQANQAAQKCTSSS